MKIIQKRAFVRSFKQLNKQDKPELEAALKVIVANPGAGELKTSNLAGVRVHKFRINRQLTLLAYTYDEASDSLDLLGFGSHENFYRNLKKNN